ncbi:DUF805 domain-containing protein [Latilactobacillus fuchuensis]|uniref:DUF805 domain-containing protein n=1 Tax=Latilactobacillus fuchuensis TaxID=164393 RepID=A0A2N9DX14_9LACO|nr:DUF805 domain-containing protein [Latilactobacillus fuchuensis]MCP8857944.1 DUF805 domain-containing protein [Latilactobacillus fuchuensis]SPC39211.1 conserved membrane hypothetical protein [Latilactobacillus fuchuensis]
MNGTTQKVTFKQALRDYFKGYFDFVGQTTRSGYWWVMLILLIIWFIPFFYLMGRLVMAMMLKMSLPQTSSIGLLLIFAVLTIALVIPTLAMSMRRYRDVGLNGRGVVVLWLFNTLASRASQGLQVRSWSLIAALIGVFLFVVSVLKTDSLITKSDNPLVTFFLRKK